MEADYQKALNILQPVKQEQILQGWELLSEVEKKQLLAQITALDIALLQQQQELIQHRSRLSSEPLDAYREWAEPDQNPAWREAGRELLASGKAGCLIIAGGQGTRLGSDGVKGAYPVSPVRRKSLFQLFAEKTIAAGKQVGRLLPLAIMVSPSNQEATRTYFEAHKFFGLSPEQVHFFCQKTLPFLDLTGKLFLEERGQIASGPDGNGDALRSFVEAGLWDLWRHQGVEQLLFIPIDNPLADPFDAALLGFHKDTGAEMTIACMERRDAEEKVGLIVRQEGRLRVVEYSEITEEERQGQGQGELKHVCANISLFCFSMGFVKRAAGNFQMPLHVILKPTKKMNIEESAWKFERFIFDLFAFTDKTAVIKYPRKYCFAPLKNSEGQNSPETVREALQEEASRVFTEVTGMPPPQKPFEISQEFYYPTAQLLKAWKGRNFPEGLDYLERGS